MNIPQGNEKEIRRQVQARLKAVDKKPSGGAKSKYAPSVSGTAWKHGKLVMAVLECTHHRIANSYWRAYCEMVAARLIDGQRKHDGAFPILNEELDGIIRTHRRGRSALDQWTCMAKWEQEQAEHDAATKSKPKKKGSKKSQPDDAWAYISDEQTDPPPARLVDAIYGMKIQPEQLFNTAVLFCQMALSYSRHLLTERGRKGGRAKNSPTSEGGVPSSKSNLSDKVRRQVLERVEKTTDLSADSARALGKDINIVHATMRRYLPALVREGLLKALQYPDLKGKRYKITAAGRKWLKRKPAAPLS